jgi:type IV pilus assembly protein PilV
MNAKQYQQRGVTLIEVLIAIFVTSIGLLGIAGLEVYSKQSGFEALQRTTASMLLNDIAEKMRANPGALAIYQGATVGGGSLSTPSTDCTTTACNASDMATYDLWEWEQLLDGATEQQGGNDTGGLASPTGCIESGGSAGVYTVSLAWRGTTPLTNPTSSSCGEDTSVHGTSNEYRRVMTIDVYVTDEGVS